MILTDFGFSVATKDGINLTIVGTLTLLSAATLAPGTTSLIMTGTAEGPVEGVGRGVDFVKPSMLITCVASPGTVTLRRCIFSSDSTGNYD